MADLLLELFSEEIPARMQKDALAFLMDSIKAKATQHGFNAGNITGYVTPRRLAVWVKDLPLASDATETELKGPKVGAPDAAMQGFLKKTGLSKEQLTEKDGAYFAIVRKDGQQTADVLKTIIEDTLASFPWPKSMRWGGGEQAWVRPLHSIMCLFDGKIIDVSFAGVHGGHMTYGHRFLARDSIMFSKADDYEKRLHEAYVIADRDKRKAEILRQAQAAADSAGLVLKQDEGLLEEVTGLVEWPTVLVGTIDAQYMDLPKEVLVSEMRAHQKYFALENKDGTLSDKFLITSNMIASDEGKAIIAGNERVLRARLADGRFFWDQDRKKPLSEWAENLKTVTYHAKLGTIADKVDRIIYHSTSFREKLYPGRVDTHGINTFICATHCKTDLVTGMVGEFPELQGIMGGYYAIHEDLGYDVSEGIRNHYKPLGPTDSVPNTPVSICVSLGDKLDTLIGMFAIGEKPTGSKDPYALRRTAIGIIRIILENNLKVNLHEITEFGVYVVLKKISEIQKHHEADELWKINKAQILNGTVNISDLIREQKTHDKIVNLTQMNSITEEVLSFIIDRLKVQLREQGIRHDVLASVLADKDDDLVRILERAKAIQQFISTDDGANLLIAYKRASNILSIEENKDKTLYKIVDLDHTKLIETDETLLRMQLKEMPQHIKNLTEKELFKDAMLHLAQLRKLVDNFFNNTMVNSENKDLRANRLRLLAGIRDCMDSVANFALIEGDLKEQKKKAA